MVCGHSWATVRQPCIFALSSYRKTKRAMRKETRNRRSEFRKSTLKSSRHTEQVDDLRFQEFVLHIQSEICKEAEEMDGSGKAFGFDKWERSADDPNAGFGITRVMEGGNLIEKGASNVSIINGKLSPTRAKMMSSRGREVHPEGGDSYFAAAMSLVFHPQSPWVPTLRADVRLFQVGEQRWYGGGCDLTPSYLFEEDASSFHSFWKDLCSRHHKEYYPMFKTWCDDYFYLPSRKEHRGIGGIFFDDLAISPDGEDAEPFVRDVGRNILNSWREIAESRRELQFDDQQRDWQLLRRGRYVEFNLLYDRGVKFGLEGGRVESIMVSAPPLVRWSYDVNPAHNTEEARILEVLKHPRSWA